MAKEKLKVMTPEQFLGIKPEPIMIHHGTCDMCGERLILIVHYNYDKQTSKKHKSFRLCKKCLNEANNLFGSESDKGLTITKTENGFIINNAGFLYIARSYIELGRKIESLFSEWSINRTGNRKLQKEKKK